MPRIPTSRERRPQDTSSPWCRYRECNSPAKEACRRTRAKASPAHTTLITPVLIAGCKMRVRAHTLYADKIASRKMAGTRARACHFAPVEQSGLARPFCFTTVCLPVKLPSLNVYVTSTRFFFVFHTYCSSPLCAVLSNGVGIATCTYLHRVTHSERDAAVYKCANAA